MASTGSFGRIKDLRLSSLIICGRTIIDSACHLRVPLANFNILGTRVLNVKDSATMCGNLLVKGNTILEELNVNSNLTVCSDFEVKGNMNIGGNLVVCSDLKIKGNLDFFNDVANVGDVLVFDGNIWAPKAGGDLGGGSGGGEIPSSGTFEITSNTFVRYDVTAQINRIGSVPNGFTYLVDLHGGYTLTGPGTPVIVTITNNVGGPAIMQGYNVVGGVWAICNDMCAQFFNNNGNTKIWFSFILESDLTTPLSSGIGALDIDLSPFTPGTFQAYFLSNKIGQVDWAPSSGGVVNIIYNQKSNELISPGANAILFMVGEGDSGGNTGDIGIDKNIVNFTKLG